LPVVVSGRSVNEFDLSRIFVRRQPVLTQSRTDSVSASSGLRAGNHHHIGLDDFRAHRVGLAHRRRKRHRRMPGQAILDLAGTDPVAR
jgi:hypothetical protein